MTDPNPDILVDSATIRRFLRLLWARRWRLICGSLILAVFAAGVFQWKTTPTYKATTLVRFDYNGNLPQHLTPVQWRRGGGAEIGSEIVALASDQMLGSLVDHLDLGSDPQIMATLHRPGLLPGNAVMAATTSVEKQEIVEHLAEIITVESVDKSFVYQISAISQDARLAENLTNGLAEVSIRVAEQYARDQAETAGNWYAGKVGALKTELDRLDDEINSLLETGSYSTERDLRLLRDRVKELRLKKITLEKETAQEDQALNSVLDAKENIAPHGLADLINDPVLTSLSGKPDIDKSAFDTRLESVIAKLKSDNSRRHRQIRAIVQNIAVLTAQISTQAEEAKRLRDLKRQREANAVLYETYLVEMKAALSSQSIAPNERRVLSWAVAEPVQKFTALAAGIVAGIATLLLGVTWIMFREFANPHLRTRNDVEELIGSSRLLELPFESLSDAKKIIRNAQQRPNVPIAAGWRLLRTRLIHDKIQTLLVTSAQKQAGKTLTALGLASAFGASGKRVLVIEATPHSASHILGQNPEAKGLTDILLMDDRSKRLIQTTELPKVDFLSIGTLPSRLADLLPTEAFSKLVQTLKRDYDILIFDAGEVENNGVTLALSAFTDAALFLIRWDEKNRECVKSSFASLSHHQSIILTVLNGAVPEKMKELGYQENSNHISATA